MTEENTSENLAVLSEYNKLSKEDNSIEFKKELLSQLENASPLDAFSILEQVEMYEARNAREVISEVYQEFETGDQRVSTIVVPVFTSIVDGLIKDSSFGKALEKKGITATRIVTECQNFRYTKSSSNAEVYSELEKNRILSEKQYDDINKKVGTQVNETYERAKYGFTDKQRREAVERSKNENGEVIDNYTGQILYAHKKEAAEAEGNTRNSAEVDHIVPLSQIHSQLKGNCMLTDDDVRNIANMDENLAVTSQEINRSKKDSSNKEYSENNNVDPETRRRMQDKAKSAQKAIDKKANQTVLHNMKDPEQLKKLGAELEGVSLNAVKDGAELGIGNVIIELLKPLYYEIADSFKNGFTSGVELTQMGDAFKFRMFRVKNHIQHSLASVGLDSMVDVLKNLVSAIINAIIDLFFGIVKKIMTLIRKGFPVAISAIKILTDPSKSASEKGDAVIKLLGGTLVAILGSMLVDSLHIEGVLKNILTCLISGCGSLIFMALMDKIDIFSVNAEKRAARIQEIFEMRIAEIQQRVSCMQVEVIDLLRKQRLCFDELIVNAEKAIIEKNIDNMVRYSYSIANFFKVELEYSNTQEFVRWWDSQKVIYI